MESVTVPSDSVTVMPAVSAADADADAGDKGDDDDDGVGGGVEGWYTGEPVTPSTSRTRRTLSASD